MICSEGSAESRDCRAEAIRHDWTLEEAEAVYRLPINDLVFQAQSLHRRFFPSNRVQQSALLSIKTGSCPEDCAYCSQSAHHQAVTSTRLMAPEAIVDQAREAKTAGATRFCLAAAWRNPRDRDLTQVCEAIRSIKQLGMETCATLGMLTAEQAQKLRESGLDFYNHNIDTSPEYYPEIITTRTFQDRLDTLERVRDAGMKVCCGGIIGLGETVADRLKMLLVLANLREHPESVPINLWNEVEGAPVQKRARRPDPIEIVRIIATARTMMPATVVRLSAGRQYMSDELHALCFLAGANSLFLGNVLLTTKNPELDHDRKLFAKLGIEPL